MHFFLELLNEVFTTLLNILCSPSLYNPIEFKSIRVPYFISNEVPRTITILIKSHSYELVLLFGIVKSIVRDILPLTK
jgi:isoprenylcysteine carboxyl methyltransferase (ICMT) family protein YpbQ